MERQITNYKRRLYGISSNLVDLLPYGCVDKSRLDMWQIFIGKKYTSK